MIILKNNNVITGLTLNKVTLKGEQYPTANDGVFGEQSDDFAIYVEMNFWDGSDTLYGYNLIPEGVMVGDINGDSDVNAKDAVLLSQIIVRIPVDYTLDAADCNGDGQINVKDSVLLAQYLAGWDVELGVATGGGDVEIPGDDLVG